MRRTAFFGILMGCVLLGSFFLTLWLTEPEDLRPAIERLATLRVSNDSELAEATVAVGLRLSPRMKGNIDRVSRTNNRDVTMAGWLADPEGDGTPLDVVVFVAGTMVARTATNGERPDVTQAVGLAFGVEKNVSFQVSFTCGAGEQPVVAGLGAEKQYFPLVSPRCPQGP
jgi:hypothetical protein